jgi:D-alanyl-D-alanine carboxypeptidase/D-alanyl-D-alanine-endopeptidase (penicillin-binding protein 4)
LLLLCAYSFASAAGYPILNEQLEAVIKQELPPNFSVSVQVADAESGRILMEKNPDLPLIPASTMKVVTSSAALQVLKPDYTFVTEVFTDEIKAGSAGNLYLKGKGDPYLVSEQLFALTRELKDRGLTEVRGGIVVDDSYFIPGKPLDEQERLGYRSYHAPYSALSLNFNSIRILVHPGPEAGRPAVVIADPSSEYAVVKASVKTVPGRRAARLTIKRESSPSGRDVILVGGSIGRKAEFKSRYVNVTRPSLYTGEVFKEFLLREGIRVTGKVVPAKVPKKAVSLLQFHSRPLGIIVYWLNKFSNNFMAEQIALGLGAAVHGVPGTREKGLSVIRRHLLDLGVDEGLFSLSEASGLSRKNRLSASALVRVLTYALHDFSYSWEFASSLGVAGIDGTLKKKFRDKGAVRRIRAKTGNLRGVNALAGFGVSREGRVFVFSVLVNSLKNGTGFIRYAERITRAILDMPLDKK